MTVTIKNLLSFLLVLCLTVFTVSVLSIATQAKTDTAAVEYQESLAAQEEQTPPQLTAVVSEGDGIHWLACVGAFMGILLVPATGLLLYRRAVQRGKASKKSAKRRYTPRADMLFSTTTRIRG